MNSMGGLFERVASLENLRLAAHAASRGKRGKPDVAAFLAEGDGALVALREQLLAGSYEPGGYRQFRVLDPKPRTISCAPFRDRVVHHAVCDLAMPLVERRFIGDSFACRKGMGTHRAVARAQDLVRRQRFLRTRRRHRDREDDAAAGRLAPERLVASTRAAEGILAWFGLRGILPQGVEA